MRTPSRLASEERSGVSIGRQDCKRVSKQVLQIEWPHLIILGCCNIWLQIGHNESMSESAFVELAILEIQSKFKFECEKISMARAGISVRRINIHFPNFPGNFA